MADEAVAMQKPKAPRIAIESRRSKVGLAKGKRKKRGGREREGSNRESSRVESGRVGRKEEKDGEICLGDRNGLTF